MRHLSLLCLLRLDIHLPHAYVPILLATFAVLSITSKHSKQNCILASPALLIFLLVVCVYSVTILITNLLGNASGVFADMLLLLDAS